MSNLFDPRFAAQLKGRLAPRGLPPAPPSTRVHPQPITQPLLPLHPPLQAQPQVAATPGGVLDVVTPGHQASSEGKFNAYMRRHPNTVGLPSQTTPEPLQPITLKALRVLNNPQKNYQKADLATKLLLARPGPRLQAIIDSDPEVRAQHAVVLSKMAKELGSSGSQPRATPAPVRTTAQPGSAGAAMAQLEAGQQQQVHQAPEQYGAPVGIPPAEEARLQAMAKAGLLDPFAGNLPKHLLTEAGQTLVGLGPGLAQMGYGLATNPKQEIKKVGGALAHSYGQTIHHPGRQLSQDPLGLVTNIATAPFVAAGAAARASELGRAGELAQAAGTTLPRQVAKTLIRPLPQERSVSLKLAGEHRGGVKSESGVTPLDTIGGMTNDIHLDAPLSSNTRQALVRQANELAAKHGGQYAREFADSLTEQLSREPEYQAYIAHEIPGTEGDALNDFSIMDKLGKHLDEAVGRGADDRGTGFGEAEHRWFFDNPEDARSAVDKAEEVLKSFGIKDSEGNPVLGDVFPEQPQNLREILNMVEERSQSILEEARRQQDPKLYPKMSDEGRRISLKVAQEWEKSLPFFRELGQKLNELKGGVGSRGLTLPPTEERTPLTLRPPAYKSALGGYLQTKVLDPLLERHLAQPNPYTTQLSRGITNFIHAPSGLLSAPARFGRKLRQDFENEVRIRAGRYAAEENLAPEEAMAKARGTAFSDRWRQLYDAGASSDEAALQPWRDWVAIKQPPETVKIRVSDWDSESKLANKFGKGGIVPSAPELEKDPGAFRYVPAELLRSMTTYKPGTGALNTVAQAINRGTQLIRSGRFMTPAYAQWAVQNGLIHLSQAGPFVFRNAWQLKTEWPKLSKVTQNMIDGGMGGGIAMATSGGLKTGRVVSKLQHIWHNFDDRWARRMSAIHELNANGLHTAESWDNLAKTKPTKFRQIVAGQGNREAINYTEMTPSERSLFARLFTAYGWTRGASTYAARFPLQHPVQARIGVEAGQEGSKTVDEFYRKLGGMAPNWMRELLPLPGNHVLGTEWLNPAGTLGGLIGEVPGATIGQTENLMGEAAPIPAMLGEMTTGVNRFGTAYKGSQRFTGPISEAAGRFKPLAAIKTVGSVKKGGTFTQGPEAGLLHFAGIPLEQLRNPKQTAALGEKDYEQSLATPDKIQFRHARIMQLLPQEVQMYTKATGQPPPDQVLSRLQGDADAVEQRDLYQYHYANNHGAKSWKSLPATNKLSGTLDFLAQHNLITPEQYQAFHSAAANLNSETEMERFVSSLWHIGGIGSALNAWKSMIRQLTPRPLQAANK